MVNVSVIIPVFNVENFIRKTLSSICNQTYRDLEIIIIDDGSTDKSGVICDQLALNEPRIKVFHQENMGPTKTRNYGMQLATGRYFCFIDADDWISKNYIKALVEASEKENADIAFCNHAIVNNAQVSYNDDYHQALYVTPKEKNALLCQIFFPAVHGKIYRNSSLKTSKVEFLVQDGYHGFAEDIFFNFEAINNAKKLVFVAGEYYFYNRDNPNSICALPSKQEVNNNDRLTILAKIFSQAQKMSYRNEISPTLQEISAQHIQWGKEDMARKFIKSSWGNLTKSEHNYLMQIAHGVIGQKRGWVSRLLGFKR